MRAFSVLLALLATAAVVWSAPSNAVTCYVVMDRNDNVVYQSTQSPVDLSDQGASAREAMRQRGDYLMFGEFETCPAITFFTGAGGSRALALDQMVNGMPPASGAGAQAAPDAPDSQVQSAKGAKAGARTKR